MADYVLKSNTSVLSTASVPGQRVNQPRELPPVAIILQARELLSNSSDVQFVERGYADDRMKMTELGENLQLNSEALQNELSFPVEVLMNRTTRDCALNIDLSLWNPSERDILSATQICVYVQHLDLRGVQAVTDDCFHMLLGFMRHLKVLDLAGCWGIGGIPFQPSTRSSSLTFLNLSSIPAVSAYPAYRSFFFPVVILMTPPPTPVPGHGRACERGGPLCTCAAAVVPEALRWCDAALPSAAGAAETLSGARPEPLPRPGGRPLRLCE